MLTHALLASTHIPSFRHVSQFRSNIFGRGESQAGGCEIFTWARIVDGCNTHPLCM